LKLQEIDLRQAPSNSFPTQNLLAFSTGLSSFVLALIIYLFINGLMLIDHRFSVQIQPSDYPEKNDIWWSMHHYQALKTAPGIFF